MERIRFNSARPDNEDSSESSGGAGIANANAAATPIGTSHFAIGRQPEQPGDSEASDELLAELAQHGGMDAIDSLVRRYQTRLMPFLLRRGLSRELAEDVFQETCLTMFRQIGQFDLSRSFSTWVFTIAVRIANRARTSRQQENSDQRIKRHGHEVRCDESHVCQQAPAVEQQMITRESQAMFWEKVQEQVSSAEWTALLLFYVEGMTVDDIATVLEKTTNATKMILSRGRRRLKRHCQQTKQNDAEHAFDQALRDLVAG